MLLQQAMTGYLEHIRYERKLSRTTVEHYTSWLHSFTDWLSANGYDHTPTLEDFNEMTLRRYQYL
jgi:site-specific recombinase XerD